MGDWELYDMRNIDNNPKGEGLHVLMVSNHWEAKKRSPVAGVFVDRQIDSLRKAGVKISIFDVGTSHSPVQIFRKWLRLRRMVRKLCPDLVHGHYGTIVGLLVVFAGRPSIISFCGGDLIPGHSFSVVRVYSGFVLSNIAALRAKLLICKSESLRQALWWCKDRAVVIPNGVDLDRFCPGPQDIARKQLGWDQESQVVLFNAGSDPKRKGLNVAQEAMKVVRRQLPNAKLCVISDVKPDVMPVYYRSCDALLSASLSEGSPNVVKEALACNLPVVATSVGDVEERLAGVQPSAVVPRNAEAIGEALVKILLERKRSNGREQVANLSLEHIADRVIHVYQSVLMAGCDETLFETDVRIIPLKDEYMVRDAARLHFNAFAGYLNCSLGINYICAFIRWFVEREDSIAIAAVRHDQEVIGYAIGAPTGYNEVLNRELFWVVVAAVLLRPWLFFRPSFWQVIKVRLMTILRFRRQAAYGPCCELLEPRMSLVALGVGRSWRRKGVGLLLMQGFKAKAKELKMRSLVLSVLKRERPARKFYEKCGWRPCMASTGISEAIKYCRSLNEND